MAPSASLVAQKRRKAVALRATVMLCGLFVKAMRQLTQSVKVVVSVSERQVQVTTEQQADRAAGQHISEPKGAMSCACKRTGMQR